MEKSYNPKEIEGKWYKFWKEKGYFTAKVDSPKPRFSMVIPPPNVTGTLHMGHAFVFTLYDIVARWKRMQGYETLWLPGTDHAGIATQMVVERELAKEGLTRHQLGREKFLERVWEWTRRSQKIIEEQLMKMGASVDWTRNRFTLSPELSRAVIKAFVELYKQGLIYRDFYLVNWCPRCHTALSDLEVEHKEVKGKLYYIKYPFKDKTLGHITVATTRPETMLGDTAVAVHPEDERYSHLVGKTIVLPIVGREIPVIADEAVDPEFGTGAVKVTPAHDPDDFKISKRHNLPAVVVIDDWGKMTADAGQEFEGLDRYEARKKVVEKLQELGLIEKIEDYTHAVGHCQRCGTVIEPHLSWQWFVRVKPLAEPAIKVVEEGKVRFIPENWKKLYFEWMYNIHDWCISRQLWWGHRIPAWFCDDCGKITVEETPPEKCAHCGSTRIHQDEDVLDTWFSSALWPFSTLGWPDETEDLKRFYPTDLLITGFDIIFFWVARMIMMGLRFMGDVPFYEVFINGLIRDEKGQKMSKTKGNVIDPLDMIEKYGADALRFTLAVQAVPGMDISLSEARMAGYRAFANKIWNAARFVLMNYSGEKVEIDREKLNFFDRWILSRLNRIAILTNRSLSEYKFYEAAERLYHFIWHEFCDWYIELSKPDLNRGNSNTEAVLITVLESTMRLLHPFMPFITEEIWQKLPHEGESIVIAPYPEGDESWLDERIEEQMQHFMDLVSEIRKIRSENKIDPKKKIKVLIKPTELEDFFRQSVEYIAFLTRAESIDFVKEIPEDLPAFRAVSSRAEIAVPLEGLVDVERERERIEKDISRIKEEMQKLEKRLNLPGFREKAPKEVVEKTERAYKELQEKLSRLEAFRKMLG